MAKLRRDDAIDGIILSTQAILHELPKRSYGFKKYPSKEDNFSHMLARIFKGFQTCLFYAREPCKPKGWPNPVEIQIPNISGNDLARYAESVSTHLHMVTEKPEERLNDFVRMEDILAVETIHKLRQETKNRFLYEMGEQLTSFDPDSFRDIISKDFDPPNVSIDYTITQGFKDIYGKLDIKARNIPGRYYGMPFTHVYIIAFKHFQTKEENESKLKSREFSSPSGTDRQEVQKEIITLSQESPRITTQTLIPFKRNIFLCHKKQFISKIKKLLGKLATYNSASICLRGLSGTGKTAMAIEYAYESEKEYPGGRFCLVLDYPLPRTIKNFFTQIEYFTSQDIDLEKANDESLLKHFNRFFKNRDKSLLILDNVSEPNILPKLSELDTNIIVTTQIANLPFPSIDMDIILKDSSKAFDILLSYAEKQASELTESARQAAEKICERVGNLPLALEIMGNIAKAIDFVNLKDDLDDVINKRAHTQIKGKISIRDALALAKKKFDNPLAFDVLQLIAYFNPDNIDPQIVSQVLDINIKQTNAALGSLAKFSIVKGLQGGGYSVHRLIQESARDLDTTKLFGSKFIDWLIQKKQEAWGSGYFKDTNNLIPHMTNVSWLSNRNQSIAEFPPEEKVFDLINFSYQTGHFFRIEDIFAICIERIKKRKDDIPAKLTQRYNSLAMAYWYLGYYEKAAEAIELALEQEKIDSNKNPQHLAHILDSKGLIQKNLGKRDFAEEIYQDIFNIDKQLIESILEELIKKINHYPEDRDSDPKISAAKPILEITLKIIETILSPDIKAFKLNNLAKPFVEEIYRDILDIDKSIASILRDFAKHINNYAVVLREQQKFHEAKPLFEMALKITEITKGPDDRTIAFHLSNLAVVMNGLGFYDESDNLFQREIQILEDKYTKESRAYSIHLQRWGNALIEQERYKEAEKLFSEAISIFERVGNLDHPELLKQIFSLFDIFLVEDIQQANQFLKEKFDKFVTNLGEDHPYTIEIQRRLESI